MEYLAAMVVIAVIVAACSKASHAGKKARLLAAASSFVQRVQEDKFLPRVLTNVMLKAGESAFYSAPAKLYETRAVRYYQSSGSRVRVMKGFSIGSASGRSASRQEMGQVDMGLLVVTNRRLIFDGTSENRTVAINKIISVNPGNDYIEVSSEQRNKSMIFSAENPLILTAIVRICGQVEDPLDLSDTKLEVEFV